MGAVQGKEQQELTYIEVKEIIQENLATIRSSFISVGYYLKYVRDHKLYLEDGYHSIWEFAEDNYGLRKSTASRWMTINDRFSEYGNSPHLARQYQSFGKSQLQEMLYLTDEQIKLAEPEMTAKEIRAIRKPEESQQEDKIIPVVELKKTNKNPVAPAQQEMEHKSEEIYEELSERSDLELLQEEIRRENRTLEELKDVGYGENDIRVRKQKLLVAALAGFECDLDIAFNPPEELKQPELPILKNNGQRKAWLQTYKDWGLWYEDKNIGCQYYKYDFENGARLIAEVYPRKDKHLGEHETGYLHLVVTPKIRKQSNGKWNCYETYSKYPSSDTELVEFLKFVQKGKK